MTGCQCTTGATAGLEIPPPAGPIYQPRGTRPPPDRRCPFLSPSFLARTAQVHFLVAFAPKKQSFLNKESRARSIRFCIPRAI